MSKKYFTEEELTILSQNKFVVTVSKASITYSDKFKKIFIDEYLEGNLPLAIFEKYGFQLEILGKDRIKSSAKRWKAKYRRDGFLGVKDTRKTNSGRPLKRELTSDETIKSLKAKVKLLEAENELLKKLKLMERGGF